MAGSKDATATALPVCFVIMPISDVEPYGVGHFRRVYDHLIVPACQQAGFEPLLASDVKEANMIVIDVLRRLYTAEMVLCDLSSRNPNVLFELGFRQAFNKPVTLIKDLQTERIFDISGMRDIPYDESLRIDVAHVTIREIAERMRATFDAVGDGSGGVNSLVQLLGVEPAVIPQRTQISSDTQILLDAVRDLSDRVRALEPAPVRVAQTKILSAYPVKRFELRIQGTSDAALELAAQLQDRGDMSMVAVTQRSGQPVITGWARADVERQDTEVTIARLAGAIGDIQKLEHRWFSNVDMQAS